MKKLLLLLATTLIFALTALAQGTSSTQTTTGSTGSTETTTTTTKTTTKGKKAKGASTADTGTASTSGAASTEKSTAASGKSAKAAGSSTLTGCLAKGADGNGFVLTNGRYKSGVAVKSDQDLSAHAGHTVKLTGSWEKPTAGAAGGAGPKGKQIRTFTATDFKHVSDTCGAGTKASGAAAGTSETGASAKAGHKHTTSKKTTTTTDTTTTAAPK